MADEMGRDREVRCAINRYCVDSTASDIFDLYIRDLTTGAAHCQQPLGHNG